MVHQSGQQGNVVARTTSVLANPSDLSTSGSSKLTNYLVTYYASATVTEDLVSQAYKFDRCKYDSGHSSLPSVIASLLQYSDIIENHILWDKLLLSELITKEQSEPPNLDLTAQCTSQLSIGVSRIRFQ